MEDERIIALYFAKDEAAIEETRRKYGAYCFATANRIIRDSSDAEECVNDTYLHAWNAIPPAKPDNLKLFLAKIARNLAIDRCRHTRAELLCELEECLPAGSDTEGEAMARELGGAVNAFLFTLAERDCNIFLRRYFFAESTEEIAKKYGVRASNVLLILSRTRQKLKKYLEAKGFNV